MFITAHWELDNQSPAGLSRPELLTGIAKFHRLEKHSEERRLADTAAIDALDALDDHGTEHVIAAADAAEQVSPEAADQLVDDAVAAPADLFLQRTRHWIANDRMLHVHAVLDPVSGRELVADLDSRVGALWRADDALNRRNNNVYTQMNHRRVHSPSDVPHN